MEKVDRQVLEEQNESKFSFFPIDANMYYFWTKAGSLFWTVHAIDLSKDKKDFDAVDEGTQNCIMDILSFFSQVDGLVLKNIDENFKENFNFISDIKPVYISQEFVETIHNEMYSILIDTFIIDPDQKAKCLDSIKTHPTVKIIGDLIFKWMSKESILQNLENGTSISSDGKFHCDECEQCEDKCEKYQRYLKMIDEKNLERVLAFILIEGMLFQGAFAFIYYLKSKGLFSGFTESNEYIARDEALHTEFGIYLFKILTSKYNFTRTTQEKVYEIVDDFLSVGEVWVREALNPERCKHSDISITSDELIQYLKSITDVILDNLGYEKRYNVENPFDFMILQQLLINTNFFEDKVTSYSKGRSLKNEDDEHII